MERTFCPKCGYQRQSHDPSPFLECPGCGIVFAKYAQHLADKAAGIRPARASVDDHAATDTWPLAAWLIRSRAISREQWIGEALLLLGLIAWGVHFVACDWRTGDAGESFLHQANLPFHEFGHVLFRPLGQWMMFLGGSLFQCLLPILLGGVFLIRERQPFAAAVCLWWAGQNLIDIAPYIGDARSMDLPLIGEANEEIVEMRYLRHDWHNILEPIGMLDWDHRLAALSHWAGATIMLVAVCWAATGLWQVRQQASHARD